MHYIVTGGCGFIGSHLCDRLLRQGHSLCVIDDLSTGSRANLPPTVDVIKADITTPGIFDAPLKQADGVFHLAAISSVAMSQQHWLRTHQVNQGGLVALLDAVANSERKIPVVYASSAAVYGDSPSLPLTENTPCRPLSAYGLDKLACEWQARIAGETHSIPTMGLRFFNVYGPRQSPDSPYSGVISIFAKRMKHGETVRIYGDGNQSRDFIFVEDVTDALLRAMQGLEEKRLQYGVFNVCTGKSCSIESLARMMSEICGSRSALGHEPARPGDIRHSAGDPAAAAQALGFRAATALEDGLRQTMESL